MFYVENRLREPYQELRISDADIDPSFPVELQQHNLIRTDFLGNRDVPVEEWILRGGLPNLEPYLIVDELCRRTRALGPS